MALLVMPSAINAQVLYGSVTGNVTDPAGAAIVITVGPIRQVMQGDGTAPKRYLVIATGTPVQPGEPVQVQTRP